MQHIDNKQKLIEYFLKGSKTKDSWRIGTEHEKFLFDLKNKTPIPYDGDISIVKIFSELEKNNWIPIKEERNILGLIKDKKNITLEHLSFIPTESTDKLYDLVKNYFQNFPPRTHIARYLGL